MKWTGPTIMIGSPSALQAAACVKKMTTTIASLVTVEPPLPKRECLSMATLLKVAEDP